MGKDKLTRDELIQYLEGYCAGHKFCTINGIRCKLLSTYCGGFMLIDDLPNETLIEIYNYIQSDKEDGR